MPRPIAFIENKSPDFSNISGLLGQSASANRWANFGPLWSVLKNRIEGALDLPASRCAIPCASGTSALFAAAALAERERPLRWLIPDYAFRATAVGPFENGTIVDCNDAGTIDAGLLQKFDPDTYDGVVAINPFGLMGDMNGLVGYVRGIGKTLIIDNAPGFLGFDRARHDGIFECLSFHHTKPFGFGEGGCLIADRADRDDARAALDFGYQWRWPGGKRALANGKMSEPAAAFILDRIDSAAAWSDQYRRQFERVLNVAKRHDFRPLVDEANIGEGVYGNVPLLCPHSIPAHAIDNPTLHLAKYYKPVIGLEKSSEIYSRIVNVPCHKDVAELGERELARIFSGLLRASRK